MAAQMTEEHKQALAKGRRQARAVRNYLDALERDKRGGRLDEEEVRERIQKLDEQLADEDDRASRVELQQKRIDLEQQLEDLEETQSLEDLEDEFAEVVRDYSARKSISYMAWREEGVPASVLKRGGLKRSYNPPEQEG